MAVQPVSLFIFFASLFALFTAQLPRARGESNDALFQVAAKGKSDTTCNCANFNDVICRNCYDKVIKCNQVCAQQCCQYSTFNPDGKKGKKGDKKGGDKKKKEDKKKPKQKNEQKKPPRRKPNSLSYSVSYRYRGHLKHGKKGKRGKRGKRENYRSYSMSHSLRYHGRLHGRSHHVSALASDVELDYKTPEYEHQVSPHAHLGGERGRALRWSSDTPKRVRS